MRVSAAGAPGRGKAGAGIWRSTSGPDAGAEGGAWPVEEAREEWAGGGEELAVGVLEGF